MEVFGFSSSAYVVGFYLTLTGSCSLHGAVFQTQAYLLVGLLVYVALAMYGKYINFKRANAWYSQVFLNPCHLTLLQVQRSPASPSRAVFFTCDRVGTHCRWLHGLFQLLHRSTCYCIPAHHLLTSPTSGSLTTSLSFRLANVRPQIQST